MNNTDETENRSRVMQILDKVLDSTFLQYFILFILAYFIAITFTGCTPSEDPKPIDLTALDNMNVPSDFNWATSEEFDFELEIKIPAGQSLENYEGLPIDILSNEGTLIMRRIIKDGKANFHIKTPTTLDFIKINCPLTDDEMSIEKPTDKWKIEFLVSDIAPYTHKVGENDDDHDGVQNDWDEFPQDATKAFVTREPYSGATYHAFEDTWPNKGDDDYNDLVTSSVCHVITDASGKAVEMKYDLTIENIGSDKQTGLMLQLLQNSDLSTGRLMFSPLMGDITIIESSNSNIEIEAEIANTISIIKDLSQFPKDKKTTISFSIDLKDVEEEIHQGIHLDLFICAEGERGNEIHTVDGTPTSAADLSLLGTGDDASTVNNKYWYRNDKNIPWAIEMWGTNESYGKFIATKEGISIMQSYPNLKKWAESGGTENTDWFLNQQ